MTARIKRPAVVILGVLALLSLTACTDPSALGAIPSDAPIDTVAEPTPTGTPDDWYSAAVSDEPDWEGMSLGEVTVNGEQYSYLEVEDEEPTYRNITEIPFEVGDTEPKLDTSKPFVLSFKSGCRTTWTDASAHLNDEGEATEPKFHMFIAKTEKALDGAPVSCTTDNMNYEGEPNSWAWFDDPNFSDGQYFLITTVEDSVWRQVVPITISTGILDKQNFGIEENGIWHDSRAAALPGEQREINWFELTKVKPKSLGNDEWWDEPRRESFFTVPEVSIAGSGTNSDPISGSFVAVLEGEHRITRTETWVLGREKDATSGPEISCSLVEDDEAASAARRYECDIWEFVDTKGNADKYYLILTSQPGDVRQVFEVATK
ncbi:hypothetical protein ACFY9N_05750 [Microbacterium sp. NPDC008134]|uniref:hypothetical protein n=1 Tax=Microbacterium sp. NPDC008134 TaxID=3364183 RepID=UPI0036ED844C